MPATMGMRNPSMRLRNVSRTRKSKTGWVTPYSAPASTFHAKRRTSLSRSGTPGLAATAMVNPVDAPMGLPPMSSPWFSRCTIFTSPMASTS